MRKIRVGLLSVALTMALTAVSCGSADPQVPAGAGNTVSGAASGGGTGAAPAAPAATKVDKLIFSVIPPTRFTNSNRLLATPYGWQLSPMHEYLIAVSDKDGRAEPQLATDWSVEPDGKSIRFKLRKGIQFHNGRGEMTSADFPPMVAELKERGGSPDDFHAGLARFWNRVDGIDVINDYEFVINMSEPDSTVFNFLGQQVGGFEVYSAKHLEENGGKATMTGGPLDATGPYQFGARDQESSVSFKRVSTKHWRITPDFPEFEFRFVSEASTRMASLLTGEVHMAQLPEDLLQRVLPQGFKTVRSSVPAQRIFINAYCCQLKNPDDPSEGHHDASSPLIDVRVRKALSKAINLKELNDAFYKSKAQDMFNNPWHPVRRGWNPDWEKNFKSEYGYDVEAAKKLLAEAGYSDAKKPEINLLVARTPGVTSIEDLTEAISGYWRKIGVDVNLVSMDTNTIRGKARNFELLNHYGVQGTSSDQWIGIAVINSTLQRPATRGPHSLDVDAVLKEIAVTLDDKKLEELWKEAGDLAYKDHKFIPLFWLPVEAVVDPKVVAEYNFAGSVTGNWFSIWNIKAAK